MSTVDPTDAFLGIDAEQFTEPMARAVLAFSTSEMVKQRSSELADKSNFGTITQEEQIEYERYIELAEVLAIMKARARNFLASRAS